MEKSHIDKFTPQNNVNCAASCFAKDSRLACLNANFQYPKLMYAHQDFAVEFGAAPRHDSRHFLS